MGRWKFQDLDWILESIKPAALRTCRIDRCLSGGYISVFAERCRQAPFKQATSACVSRETRTRTGTACGDLALLVWGVCVSGLVACCHSVRSGTARRGSAIAPCSPAVGEVVCVCKAGDVPTYRQLVERGRQAGCRAESGQATKSPALSVAACCQADLAVVSGKLPNPYQQKSRGNAAALLRNMLGNHSTRRAWMNFSLQ